MKARKHNTVFMNEKEYFLGDVLTTSSWLIRNASVPVLLWELLLIFFLDLVVAHS